MAKQTNEQVNIWNLLTNDIGANELWDNMVGANEVATSITDGLLSLVPQGLNTIAGLPFAGVDDTIKSNEKIANYFTRQPETERGQEQMQSIANNSMVQKAGELDQGARNWMGERATDGLLTQYLPDSVKAGLYAAGTIAPEIVGGGLFARSARGLLGGGDISKAYKPGMKNQAGSVGTPSSKTFKPGAEKMAREMRDAGKSRDDIWRATGEKYGQNVWFDIDTGDLRYEIPDTNARMIPKEEMRANITKNEVAAQSLKDTVNQNNKALKSQPDLFPKDLSKQHGQMRNEAKGLLGLNTGELGIENALYDQPSLLRNQFDHPALYEAYPEIGDLTLQQEVFSRDPSVQGSFGKGVVNLFNTTQDPRSVVLHEAGGHGVQSITGQAKGGSPEAEAMKLGKAKATAFQIIRNANSKMDEIQKKRGAIESRKYQVGGLSDAEKAELVDLEAQYTQQMDRKLDPKVLSDSQIDTREEGFINYELQGGEMDARNIETRRDMTPEQLHDTPWWETLDRPEEKRINNYGLLDGPSMSSAKPARRSKQQSIDDGYKHQIGNGKNLKVLVDDMTYEIDDTANLSPEIPRTPDDLLNMTGIYTAGDRSRTGGNLLSVNGEKLPKPVQMVGGPDYGRDMNHPFGWASKDSVMSNIETTVQGAKDRGSRAVGIYSPMEAKSLDFNTMTNDTVLGLMQRDMSATSKKQFDVELRKTIKAAQNAKKPTLKGATWKGVDDPASLAQLDNLGDMRHAFMTTFQKDQFQNMQNTPDLPSVRHAITKPELLDFKGNEVGQSLNYLDGGLVKDSPIGHPSYNTSMYGSHMGYLENPVPVNDAFPTYNAHRDLLGGDRTKDHRSIELKKPWQLYDRETIAGMKGQPLLDVEGSSTGEVTPYGNGGHLQNLTNQSFDRKKQYADELGHFNPYEAAGFDVDPSHNGIGVWAGKDSATEYNPVRIDKPILKGGLLENLNDVEAMEGYKGLTNIQGGSPANVQTRTDIDNANALRFNFRGEPTQKDIEALGLLGDANDMFTSPSGFGRYSLLNPDQNSMLGSKANDLAIQAVGDGKDKKGLFKGSQTALVEPVNSQGIYFDLEDELATPNKGLATAKAMKSWDKALPRIEKLLGDPRQKAYVKKKMMVDAKTALETGDVTRADYARLYAIMSDTKLTGAQIIQRLREGLKSGGLPAAGIFTFEEDDK